MPLTVGSLCSGAGQLDAAVAHVLGARHAWFAEVDPAASKVLAHRFPGVPNHGDITKADWAAIEPVDVLCAGFPCQPVSAAGRREGVNDERWLFDDIAEAVGRMEPRPRMLVFENVPGLLTANRGHAMARVIRGLAALGYVGRYRVLRASDVGAAHRRERWFCVATLADAPRFGHRDARAASVRGIPAAAVGGGVAAGELSLLPTPRATDGTKGGPNQRGSSGDLMLPSAVMRLLPTPTATPYGNNQSPSVGAAVRPSLDGLVRDADRWGEYAPAIARWETVLGRSAPDPTEPGGKGQPRLSARFAEWLMGWPDGWVTATPGLTRNDMLRIIGNGVVPQQATYAFSVLLGLHFAPERAA